MRKTTRTSLWGALLVLVLLTGTMGLTRWLGLVEWAWWVILAPLWAPLAIVAVILLVTIISMVVTLTVEMVRRRDK